MSDVDFTRYEKTKEIVDGLIDALRKKASYNSVNGAAIVMGFEKTQLQIEKAGVGDVIAIDEEEGATLEQADAVVSYCNCCLKEMAEKGVDHFDAIKYDGRDKSAGCAVLDIEGVIFMVAVVTTASTYTTERILRLGDLFCPFQVWYGTYDCMVCRYD